MVWGTYDISKPRTRILLSAMAQRADIVITEIHADVWSDVEDKGNLKSFWKWARLIIRWLAAYVPLISRYLRAPRHDIVLVGYPGHLDVLILWPFAKLRRVPIVWDAFLSLYDTVVGDRRLIAPNNPLAPVLHAWERLSCRVACRVLLDTAAHALYFTKEFSVAKSRVAHVFLGAEPGRFTAEPIGVYSPQEPLRVLFYGQFIPLHGVETIISAARLMQDEAVEWVLIGRGQESPRITASIDREPLPRLRSVPWVPYENLRAEIAASHICLGIFGTGDKAARVIPNKVFQILSVGRPLVTRDSPAMRELIPSAAPGIHLVPPGDPNALAAAIRALRRDLPKLAGRVLHTEIVARFSLEGIGDTLVRLLADTANGSRRSKSANK